MSPASTFLKGKVALVTGGTGTIGKAIACALLSEGMTVILTARRQSKLDEVRQFLLSDEGMEQWRRRSPLSSSSSSSDNNNDASSVATVHVIPSDISKEQDVIELFRRIDDISGRNGNGGSNSSSSLDLLINNAGMNIPGSAEDITASDMESVLRVNVVGAFLCAREAMVRFKRAPRTTSATSITTTTDGGESTTTTTTASTNGGRIINIGSISSYSPRPHSVAYTTSKFALHGLTKSLALDGRPHTNIAVGIIHPGNVISDLLSQEDIEIRGRTEGFISPDDVAQCVVTMANLPYSTNVLEMTVLPTTQPYIGRG